MPEHTTRYQYVSEKYHYFLAWIVLIMYCIDGEEAQHCLLVER